MIAIKSKTKVPVDIMTAENDYIYRSFTSVAYNNDKGFWVIQIISFTLKEQDVPAGKNDLGEDIFEKEITRTIIQKLTMPLTIEQAEMFFSASETPELVESFTEFFKGIIASIIEHDTVENSYFGLGANDYEIVEL